MVEVNKKEKKEDLREITENCPRGDKDVWARDGVCTSSFHCPVRSCSLKSERDRNERTWNYL